MNRFKRIPTILKFLKNLGVFLISNNNLTEIEVLSEGEFQNLDTVDIGTNKIDLIPYKLYKSMPNLKILNLENNELRNVPSDLCMLYNLNKLNLNGNPIKSMRSNIISAGSQSILDYLKKMHKFDQEDFAYEKKVMASKFNNKIVTNLNEPSQNNNFGNKNNINPNSIQTSNKQGKSELDLINKEILEVEQEINSNPNLPMYKKTDLRKKLTSLIRQRASLLK